MAYFFNVHARNCLIFLLPVWNPRPQFPTWRGNSGDSRTFKAEIGIIMFACIFRTFWHKMAVLRQNRRGVVRCWPPTNSFLLLGIVASVQLWEWAQTERQTHTVTEANWIYNLSHGICYSYAADKNIGQGGTQVIMAALWYRAGQYFCPVV